MIDRTRHLRSCFDPQRHLAGNGSHLEVFLASVYMRKKMAVSIGNGRYCKLFPGNAPPKRVLIKDLSEPGLLSRAFIQGLCQKTLEFLHQCEMDKI